MRNKVFAAMALALGSCASITEGTSQSIYVHLTPDNAQCGAFRQGTQIGQIAGSNRQLTVSKSRHDILLKCTAPNHAASEVKVESSASGMAVVGGVFLDLGLIDYATGALNKYPENVTVALAPNSSTAAK